MKLATSFGQGLQMTNILKDIWDDHKRGACWLPCDHFRKYGIDIKHKIPGNNKSGFDNALIELLGIAYSHLNNALRYTLLIPAKEKGLRKFCLWAIGMAILTLEKIRKKPDFINGEQVKISRHDVRITTLITSIFVSNDAILRYLFKFINNPNLIIPYSNKNIIHSYHLYPLQIIFNNIKINKKDLFKKLKNHNSGYQRS